jgi:hypothetical protein
MQNRLHNSASEIFRGVFLRDEMGSPYLPDNKFRDAL